MAEHDAQPSDVAHIVSPALDRNSQRVFRSLCDCDSTFYLVTDASFTGFGAVDIDSHGGAARRCRRRGAIAPYLWT